MSMNTFKTSPKTSIHFDVQLRSDDNLKNAETLIIRPGLNFHVSKSTTLTFGYAFIEGWRNIGGIRGGLPEHRIWQQLIVAHPAGKLTLNHRFRLEERFIPQAGISGNELVQTNTLYSTRLRYFFRSVIPLPFKTPFTKGTFMAVQNEAFVNLTHYSHVNGKFFDQNRAYFALGYRFNPHVDLEAGYMNQYVIGRNKAFTNNHIVQIAVYYKL